MEKTLKLSFGDVIAILTLLAGGTLFGWVLWLYYIPDANPCRPYDIYDDTLTPEIYKRDGAIGARDIEFIQFFPLPNDFGLPCPAKRHRMIPLRSVDGQTEIALLLDALQWDDRQYTEGKRWDTELGIEVTTRGGRKTFFCVQFYPGATSVLPLPEKRLAYNQSSFDSIRLHEALKQIGILDAMPGYAEFMAAHKQAP